MSRRPSDSENWAAAGLGALGCMWLFSQGWFQVVFVLFVLLLAIGIPIQSCQQKKEDREVHYEHCKNQYRNLQYQSALECFGTSIAEGTDSHDALVWRGYASLRLGHLELAQQDFDKAYSKKPDHSMTNLALGDLARAKGQVDDAEAFFQKGLEYLVENHWEGVDDYVIDFLSLRQSLGALDEEKGNHEEARRHFNDSVNTYKRNGKWHITKYNLLLDKPPYTTFVTLEEAIQRSEYSDDINLVTRVGCIRENFAGRFSSAAQCYRDLALSYRDYADYNPAIDSTFHALVAMYEANEFQDYVATADVAIEVSHPKDPRLPRLWRQRAIGHREMSQFDQALNDMNRSLELDDSEHMAYITRAMIFQRINDHPAALNDLARALSIIEDKKDEWKREVKDGKYSAGTTNIQINRNIRDIFEYQAESYRVLGRVKEAEESSNKSDKCQTKVEREQSSPSDYLSFCD